jgi:HAD superfamily hydrolase (TIGR01509 family)
MSDLGNNKLVIFDCDGVLVDSEPISFAVLREMLADAGVPLSENWAYENFLGKSMATIIATVTKEHGVVISDETLVAMRARLFERFRADLQPMPGIDTMLRGLGYARCVASSSQPERIRLCLDTTGLIDHFEPNIFSSTMVANGKPAPDLFLHAARTMGFDPSNCIVIEDSPAGITAAKAAGMTAFSFVGGSHAAASSLRSRVERLKPAVIFDDMSQLPALLTACGS